MKRFLATILTVFTLFSMAAMPVTAFASGPDDNGVSVISSDYLSSYNVYAKKGSSSGKWTLPLWSGLLFGQPKSASAR